MPLDTTKVSEPAASNGPTRRARPKHANRPLEKQSGLFYSQLNPEGSGPTIVFGHGMCSSGIAAMRQIRFAVSTLMPDAAVFAPDGPIGPDQGKHARGCVWFNLPGRKVFSRHDRPRHDLERNIYPVAERFNTFADEMLARRGQTRTDLILAGFSQGASLATHAGLDHKEACAGIINLNGNIYRLDHRPPQNDSRVFLSHVKGDDHIPWPLHGQSKDALIGQHVESFVHEAKGLKTIKRVTVPNPNFGQPDGGRKYISVPLETTHAPSPEVVMDAFVFAKGGERGDFKQARHISEVPWWQTIGVLTAELIWACAGGYVQSKMDAPDISKLLKKLNPLSAFGEISSKPAQIAAQMGIVAVASHILASEVQPLQRRQPNGPAIVQTTEAPTRETSGGHLKI